MLFRLAAVLALLNPAACLGQARAAEWRFYGGDRGGTRHSPLKQIDRRNVGRLRRAWVYHTGELELGLGAAPFQASFSTTPLVVGGVMYLSTPSSRVVALDAETGRELWKFDPQAGARVRGFNSHRGVAFWEGRGADGRSRERRVLFGTVDGRLVALNAETGKPDADFGGGGFVDLRAGGAGGGADDPVWGARVTSPPAVYKDLVIVGWGLPASPAKGPTG
ncbi:MAG TPA: PQQ-binding-like beta-propeller repeat protein, partial [Pyrinomonadaceae bacterium]